MWKLSYQGKWPEPIRRDIKIKLFNILKGVFHCQWLKLIACDQVCKLDYSSVVTLRSATQNLPKVSP